MQIEMNIKGLMIDPITNMPIIILRDQDGQRVLPIWVGVFEANAIALQIENVQTPRPMTHDLLKNIINDLHAHVQRIVVCALKENTFYATIHITVGDQAAAHALPDLRRGGGHPERPQRRVRQGVHGPRPPPEVARGPVRRRARQVQDVVSGTRPPPTPLDFA